MQVAPPILEVRDLGRRAEDDGEWLLHDINLKISAGDRIGLVGLSGSGKTLLLRSLAMLDPCSTGEILFGGKPVHDGSIPRFRAQAIYLHQHPVLFEGTVESNLRRPFELAVHCDKRPDRAKILDWLDMLDRDESFLSKDQQNLSGGEAQLTALLRAMQLRPKVLLLDEPTAALDAEATAAVERLTATWLDEKPTELAFVWVSHASDQAERMCDVIHRIDGGRLHK